MSRKCDVSAQKGVMSGNNVSHSNRKTRRRFKPNLHSFTVLSDVLKANITLRITPSTIRAIDHNDGIDNFLLKTANAKLAPTALAWKRKVRRALSNTSSSS